MVLREEDVRRIGDYVKPWLRNLVGEVAPRSSSEISEPLLERMVRVEEELKAQRELFAERFSAMDRRFEEMNRRFTENQDFMDQRFTDARVSMDQRFKSMQWAMLVGFSVVIAVVTVFGLLA